MITLTIGCILLLILALVLMIVLPIASVLAIPVLVDVVIIIGLVKICTRGKKKEKEGKN